eukprot:scaffold136539_cov127-Phaeocystis_antarctica.AAC.1
MPGSSGSTPSRQPWRALSACRLLEALLDGTALPAQLAVYYRQQVTWNRVGTANVSPFTIRAILATNALLLQQVCKTSQRARLAPPTG